MLSLTALMSLSAENRADSLSPFFKTTVRFARTDKDGKTITPTCVLCNDMIPVQTDCVRSFAINAGGTWAHTTCATTSGAVVSDSKPAERAAKQAATKAAAVLAATKPKNDDKPASLTDAAAIKMIAEHKAEKAALQAEIAEYDTLMQETAAFIDGLKAEIAQYQMIVKELQDEAVARATKPTRSKKNGAATHVDPAYQKAEESLDARAMALLG